MLLCGLLPASFQLAAAQCSLPFPCLQEERALLLCGLLLGFGLDAWVCCGTSERGGHMWVLTRSARNNATFWEPVTGQCAVCQVMPAPRLIKVGLCGMKAAFQGLSSCVCGYGSSRAEDVHANWLMPRLRAQHCTMPMLHACTATAGPKHLAPPHVCQCRCLGSVFKPPGPALKPIALHVWVAGDAYEEALLVCVK